MNGDHFSTIDNRATTLARESSHCICNLTCLRVIILDSSFSFERSLPFLTKNKCYTLLILQLVVLALSAEWIAIDLELLLIAHIDGAIWAAWSDTHTSTIWRLFVDKFLQLD
jgi:hypothetical protein